ncbi:conjugal transfer/type IV secretion protein DotA/TraY [Cupriavidus sp. YR651]|uniref:DotA/TraY family protein n=1 Tax=Cupriavidus sp. YR651 TaxID=1855315 RepID=UPI00088A79C9|nr:DotA/TraY family protein [Cupriavidus sp. YR651]SDC19864.1 conjugal transfer/type IV secretion protein DotA/TraY [Cupriavidus sp. YR651]
MNLYARRNHAILLLLALTLSLVLISWSAQTMAQSMGDMPTYGQIEAAGSGAGDKARTILNNMLGEFGQNPFAAIGPPTELLGSMFFIFNACLFVIGATWVGYHVISGIAQTAHEGEVLGKRLSTLWLPIRMTIGVGGMLPVFGGFSLAQSIMMTVGILGIGIANLLSTTAIDRAADFEAIVPPPAIAQGVGTVGFTGELGRDLFAMHVCTMLSNDFRSKTGQPMHEITFDGTRLVAPDACGSITIVTHGNSTRSSYSVLGFRNAAVDYDKIAAIADRTNQHYPIVLQSANSQIQQLAQAWFDAYAAEDGQTHMRVNPTPLYPDMAVAKTMFEAQQQFLAAVRSESKEDHSLKDRALSNMREGGWTTIGSWYSTFAEMNAAIQTAMTQTTLQVQSPEDALAVAGGRRIESVHDGLASLGIKASTAVASRTEDYCDEPGLLGEAGTAAGMGTATGNCSVGQAITLAMTNGVAGDSGGNGMVNPLIAAKNLGDWLLTGVQTAYAASVVARSTPVTAAGLGASESAGTTTVSGLQAKLLKQGGIFGTILSDLVGIAPFVLGAMLVMGMILSFYVPFIPFITWFTALVSYFASFIEGLIAAQVWAFSHLHAEGEGLGQRTEKGYLYILNMLLRPGLMVLGFFFASAASVLVGTLLFQMFGPALANVQGNSVTGVLSILGFFALLLILLILMVQVLFNMVYELPDRVIAWFGNGMEARLAKELDSKIDNHVQTFARWGGKVAMGN